jgi:hypothetical protein
LYHASSRAKRRETRSATAAAAAAIARLDALGEKRRAVRDDAIRMSCAKVRDVTIVIGHAGDAACDRRATCRELTHCARHDSTLASAT